MNIEAEIRTLKLRVDALEATARTGRVTSGRRKRARRRRMTIPAQNCTPLEDTQLDTPAPPADLTTITELRAELSQDVSALNDEIGGFRRQSNDHFSKLRGQIQDQHHSVHRRLSDLAQVIERLAKKLDA
ncbi:hypothetical protein HCN51_31810 [Nonomuraea sp. FMUSA5-5]|uniref:Uncharacterized protein n=1 Tax=Nonomuraea composti TaxID=2720023 RepID=A0ABX1B8W3_9ACTN|nr:hypothetical protein [Nonomuraea sp. FMUSA5-5]NJP93971.1 hypothetical protein [Nonomuraea sp. FMUSA5-5]